MGERTPTDFALEHAEYMAKAAERLMIALDDEDTLRLRHEEDDDDVSEDAIRDASSDRGEWARALRTRIHEFRKRRDRAAAVPPAPGAAPPAEQLQAVATQGDGPADERRAEIAEARRLVLDACATDLLSGDRTGQEMTLPEREKYEAVCRFIALVRADALEDAAQACEAEHLVIDRNSGIDDSAYDRAVTDCKNSIRAMKDKP